MMTLRGVKDPGQREQFINVFREIISSEKYKQYLEIEKEDIKIILQYEKRKKWWELTPLEFFKAKRSFYGDSPARILENLYKKPYLTLVEMKRLIKYYSESSVKHYDFRMNLGNSLKWITDDQAEALSESGATVILMNKKILTPKQKEILGWKDIIDIKEE